MSEEMQQDENLVEILSEDGQVLKCQIYDVVDFEDKTYALLLPYGEDEEDEDSEVIVMEYVEENDEGYFQNIDDEQEFQRVCEYIQSLSDEDEEE